MSWREAEPIARRRQHSDRPRTERDYQRHLNEQFSILERDGAQIAAGGRERLTVDEPLPEAIVVLAGIYLRLALSSLVWTIARVKGFPRHGPKV